jgi:glycosyltransferase involved in cell wall biosynthesis
MNPEIAGPPASVSVVIPTYNCADLLPRAIESAYAQTNPPLEVVVINDGCTDDTDEVVRALAPRLPSTFRYEVKPNGGEASARNAGVKLATGDYIAFLDQDDIWMPNKLEHQMALFEDDCSLTFAFTAMTRISSEGREVVRQQAWESRPEAVLGQLLIGCCITPSTVVVRRAALEAVGMFDESLWLGCDWDMWFRLVLAGHRAEYLDEALTDYLWLTGSNMSSDRRKIAAAADVILPRVFADPRTPPSIQARKHQCYARWYLNHAEFCLEQGDGKGARRLLRSAVRAHPGSLRPGWALLYGRSFGARSAAARTQAGFVTSPTS